MLFVQKCPSEILSVFKTIRRNAFRAKIILGMLFMRKLSWECSSCENYPRGDLSTLIQIHYNNTAIRRFVKIDQIIPKGGQI